MSNEYVTRQIRSQNRASSKFDRRAKDAIIVCLAGFLGLAVGAGNFVQNPPQPEAPATRIVKVWIGTGCPNGDGPGSQVVSDDVGDEAFDGCRELESHEFAEEVR